MLPEFAAAKTIRIDCDDGVKEYMLRNVRAGREDLKEERVRRVEEWSSDGRRKNRENNRCVYRPQLDGPRELTPDKKE